MRGDDWYVVEAQVKVTMMEGPLFLRFDLMRWAGCFLVEDWHDKRFGP